MLFSALAKNGYTLAQNLEYQPYGAAMQIALLPQLAKDIAANKVDAAVVLGWPAAAAMKDTGIPTVVAVGAGDPVATGLINSLAHPGGRHIGQCRHAEHQAAWAAQTSRAKCSEGGDAME